jgi:hypothetical protein
MYNMRHKLTNSVLAAVLYFVYGGFNEFFLVRMFHFTHRANLQHQFKRITYKSQDILISVSTTLNISGVFKSRTIDVSFLIVIMYSGLLNRKKVQIFFSEPSSQTPSSMLFP